MLGHALAVAAYELDAATRERVLARLVDGESRALGDSAIAAARTLDQRAAPATHARGAVRATRGERAAWAAAARAPTPPGLRGVHPSWIEHALRDLPMPARDALARGGQGERPLVAVWLARWACAAIPPMPPIVDVARPVAIDGVLAWGDADLARWLLDVGADQLAWSTSVAGEAMAGAVARRFPAVAEARARIAVAPRLGALGPPRAAIERCRVPHDEQMLVRIGARAVAPHVARATTAFAAAIVALRLPRPLGRTVADELAAWAATPLDRAPAWAALAA